MHRRFGLTHVRITGGEPLLHVGVVDFVRSLRTNVPKLSLAMTTNGQRLAEYAAPLRSAGLDRLNVSLDSIKPDRYRALTGGNLAPVLDGLKSALDAGFPPPKVNVVVLRGQNDQELVSLVHWALERDIELRFLEAMPIGPAADFNRRHFVSADEIEKTLRAEFRLSPLPKDHGATAQCYFAEGVHRSGIVGLIAPMTRPFCGGCGRVRLTADGLLYPCLLDPRHIDLKSAWVDESLDEFEADRLIRSAVRDKLAIGPRQQPANMISLGG